MPLRLGFLCAVVALFAGCSTTPPPTNVNNLCHILDEYPQWYDHAKASEKKWRTPVHIQFAIVHQESKFVADASPSDGWLTFSSNNTSAYGYAQAIDSTWENYLRQNNAWGAERDNMEDALDFIGWYNHGSKKRLGISLWNTRDLYLAYHEGRGGYERKTHLKKGWLMDISQKVAYRAGKYRQQLKTCEAEIIRRNDSWF